MKIVRCHSIVFFCSIRSCSFLTKHSFLSRKAPYVHHSNIDIHPRFLVMESELNKLCHSCSYIFHVRYEILFIYQLFQQITWNFSNIRNLFSTFSIYKLSQFIQFKILCQPFIFIRHISKCIHKL